MSTRVGVTLMVLAAFLAGLGTGASLRDRAALGELRRCGEQLAKDMKAMEEATVVMRRCREALP